MVKAFVFLKCIPYTMLTQTVEFSPIGEVARAIVLLSGTEDRYTVFRSNNVNVIQMNNVIEELNKHGYGIRRVTFKKFSEELEGLGFFEEDDE